MYYSKNSSVSVPRNYGGNAFKVIDESDRTYKKEAYNEQDSECGSQTDIQKNDCKEEVKEQERVPWVSSLLSGISLEDLLLLGLIFVIHDSNPNDPVLLLLLILLLAK